MTLTDLPAKLLMWLRDNERSLSKQEDALVIEITALRVVAHAARAYREAETDGTPRMCRGKALQDLANKLDNAIAQLPETK